MADRGNTLNIDLSYLVEASPRQPRQKSNTPVLRCPCCNSIVSRLEPHLVECFFNYINESTFQDKTFESDINHYIQKYNRKFLLCKAPTKHISFLNLPKTTLTRTPIEKPQQNYLSDQEQKETLDILSNALSSKNFNYLTPNRDYNSNSLSPLLSLPQFYPEPPIPHLITKKIFPKIGDNNNNKQQSAPELFKKQLSFEAFSKVGPNNSILQLPLANIPSSNLTTVSKIKSPRSPRSPRLSMLLAGATSSSSKELKKQEEKKNSGTVFDKISKRYTWNPNNNSPLVSSSPDEFKRLSKKGMHTSSSSKKKEKQTPFNLPLEKSQDSNVTPAYDVTKLTIRTDVLSTKKIAEMYPEIDSSIFDVSQIPNDSLVSIICLENNCFLRLTQDGRILADTPTAATHQLDVHFKLKRIDQKRIRFKSLLWDKYLWNRADIEEMNDYLLLKYKRSFTCLYMDPVTTEVKISLSKETKSVFRVLKLLHNSPEALSPSLSPSNSPFVPTASPGNSPNVPIITEDHVIVITPCEDNEHCTNDTSTDQNNN